MPISLSRHVSGREDRIYRPCSNFMAICSTRYRSISFTLTQGGLVYAAKNTKKLLLNVRIRQRLSQITPVRASNENALLTGQNPSFCYIGLAFRFTSHQTWNHRPRLDCPSVRAETTLSRSLSQRTRNFAVAFKSWTSTRLWLRV